MEHVSSRQNAVVKRFREVAREGRTGQAVLIDGPHLVAEALEARLGLEIVAFSADAATRRLAPLAARCAASGARVLTATDTVMAVVSPVKQAAGVTAIAHLQPASVDAAVAAGAPQLVLLLDGVQDPGNVGAIIRAAEACGATAVITGPGTADPFGWKALRGSMGSAFRLPVATAANLHLAVAAARTAGLRIFAAVPRGGTPLAETRLTEPSAVLLGGEGAGLAAELCASADESMTIPMHPPVESLNVAIAAALVLYEASRQRMNVAV